MRKILLILVLSCLGVAVLSQERQAMCRRMASRCQSRQTRNGRSNDVSRLFNQQCRRRIRNWQDISRCELGRATCQLTLMSCYALSCERVRRVLEPPRPTTPCPCTTRRPPRPPPPPRATPRPRTTPRPPAPPTTRSPPPPRPPPTTTTRRPPSPTRAPVTPRPRPPGPGHKKPFRKRP
ncbi:serine/arginine repetitive matrix protein 1-like [Drosophila bipectinata]|uniref:serine/arginine repetitive matrix protein 1-like n=1 Tax=Drosophila bipectinata TaxID=42026 RepID=UPI0038B2A8CA